MSTSYWGRIIVGAPMSAIYVHEMREESKTKYNEDTGEPISVKVNRVHARFGNKDLPPIEARPTSSWSSRLEAWQEFGFLEELGLNVFLSSEGYSDQAHLTERGLVGIELCSGDRDQHGITDVDKLLVAVGKVRDVLATFGYSGPVSIFSQLTGG